MLTHWTKKIIVEDGHTGSQVILDLSGVRQDVAFKKLCIKTLFREPYKFCQSTLSLT